MIKSRSSNLRVDQVERVGPVKGAVHVILVAAVVAPKKSSH